MRKVLAIVGPTALIACDSRQVYKGLKIGAGKGEEKVWMYDVAAPKRQYSVASYVREATKIIDSLREDKLPIIVGGTGLYLRGLLGEIDSLDIPPDPKQRQELEKQDVGELQGKVAALSPTYFQKMNSSDRNNKRRLVRAVELLKVNPYIGTKPQSSIDKSRADRWEVLKIGLIAPLPVLDERINQRVLSRLALGMVDEARALHSKGLSFKRMKELGLEYGILAEFLEGLISHDQMVEKLKNRIHQYARRQLVWFRKDKQITWFDVTDKGYLGSIEEMVKQWYYPGTNA
jgi:tRNA dimethylallyltransferase